MDIGIVWAFFCLVVAVISLLLFIARRNRDEIRVARAAWQAAHPTFPKDYDMAIALLWTALIISAGIIGSQELPRFVASPNIWSGVALAFGILILLAGVTIMTRFRLR